MRSAISVIVVAISAGCAQPRVQPAFVDIDRVVPKSSAVGPSVVPGAPDIKIDSSASIQSTPGMQVRGANTDARRAAILQLIQENRRIAENELAERLREAYLNAVDRTEAELFSDLDERKKELLNATFASLRPIFERYAERRAQPLFTIGLFAGYPDPDPKSRRPLPEADKFMLEQAKQTASSRKQLEVAEEWYQGQVSAVLSNTDERIAQQILNLRIELEKQRLEAESRARQEAAAQVNTELAEINPSLAQTSPLNLKPSAGQSISVRATNSPLVLTPPPDRSATILAQAREQARLDATVWAATVGYRLTESRGAPDKTEEFLEWRRKRHVGP